MCAFKKSVVIDIDGTLYGNFKIDDKKIICEIFGNSRSVKLLDKFLWSINSLDFFSNPMKRLDSRLEVYSRISGKKFSKTKEVYKVKYQELLKVELTKKKEILKRINGKYDTVIITSNLYAINALVVLFDCEIIYAPDIQTRRQSIWLKSIYGNVRYMIGNNYSDDIRVAKSNNIESIYVGESKIKKFFHATYSVTKFEEAIDILKDSS